MNKRWILLIIMILALLGAAGCSKEESPEQVVDTTLKAIQQADIHEITLHMANSEILNLGTEDEKTAYYGLVKVIYENMDYKVLALEQHENQALVSVEITNKDMSAIFPKYFTNAFQLAYKDIPSEEFETRLISLLSELVSIETKSVTTEVQVPLEKINSKWIIYPTKEWKDAIIGGMNSYLDEMNQIFS